MFCKRLSHLKMFLMLTGMPASTAKLARCLTHFDGFLAHNLNKLVSSSSPYSWVSHCDMTCTMCWDYVLAAFLCLSVLTTTAIVMNRIIYLSMTWLKEKVTHIRKEGDHIVDRDIIPTFQRYYFQYISDDFGFSDDIISKIICRTSGKFLCG